MRKESLTTKMISRVILAALCYGEALLRENDAMFKAPTPFTLNSCTVVWYGQTTRKLISKVN